MILVPCLPGLAHGGSYGAGGPLPRPRPWPGVLLANMGQGVHCSTCLYCADVLSESQRHRLPTREHSPSRSKSRIVRTIARCSSSIMMCSFGRLLTTVDAPISVLFCSTSGSTSPDLANFDRRLIRASRKVFFFSGSTAENRFNRSKIAARNLPPS